MRLACICFTKKGEGLARILAEKLEGWDVSLTRGFGEKKASLRCWTEAAFARADALLFIGAAGIAVRAVAPFLKDKTQDPAVLVMDEKGDFVVPLLSGHLGGANRAAVRLAELCGGQAVLTTATDIRGAFAVDEWAVENRLVIENPVRIKAVSSRILSGKEVALYSCFPLEGALPEGVVQAHTAGSADIALTPCRMQSTEALHLIPRCIAVGIGCRRGIRPQDVDAAVRQALEETALCFEAVEGVHSIDIKAREPGLLAFCREHGLELRTYGAQRLRRVGGSVSPSAFVSGIAGVDNVCERSALAGGGFLLMPKRICKGVTVALAQREQVYRFGGG